MSAVSAAASSLLDLSRVLLRLPTVEWGRRVWGPARLLATFRRDGRGIPKRPPREREMLRRIIAAVDARVPGGGNCYRRALLEMALDAGAAQERLYMGLKAHGGPQSGHAWLASWPDAENAHGFDTVLEM